MMKKSDIRNNKLQALCREYLGKLRYMAKKHGLGGFVDETIKLNRQNKCEATQKEVEMLSRLCDDERLLRQDVSQVLGKSYRECCESNMFDKIKKLKHTGIYSKIGALLLGSELKALQDGTE